MKANFEKALIDATETVATIGFSPVGSAEEMAQVESVALDDVLSANGRSYAVFMARTQGRRVRIYTTDEVVMTLLNGMADETDAMGRVPAGFVHGLPLGEDETGSEAILALAAECH